MLVIFRPIQHFRYQMLCPLWDPIVFTVVEHIVFDNCKHYGIPKWAEHLVTKMLYRPEDY